MIPEYEWIHHQMLRPTAARFHVWDDPLAHPDFSSTGGPIEFGFFRSNGTYSGGCTIVGGSDNYSMTLHTEGPSATT